MVGIPVEKKPPVKSESSQNEEFQADHWRKRRWITQDSTEAKMRTPEASLKVPKISTPLEGHLQNGENAYSRTMPVAAPKEFAKWRDSESVERFRQKTRVNFTSQSPDEKLSKYVDEMMHRIRRGFPRDRNHDANRILFLKSADGLTKVIFTTEADCSRILESRVIQTGPFTSEVTSCSYPDTPMESRVIEDSPKGLEELKTIHQKTEKHPFQDLPYSRGVPGLAQPPPLARVRSSPSGDPVTESLPYLDSSLGPLSSSFGGYFVQSLPESLREAVQPNLPFVQDHPDSGIPQSTLLKTSPTPDSTLATILEFI